MKAVLDTNVLMSGSSSPVPPREILRAWRLGAFEIAVSPEILGEYYKVARRLAGTFPFIDPEPILSLIVAGSEIVQAPKLPAPACEDPDDDKFLACDMASNSDVVVSGDRHLLRVSPHRGIRVVRPKAFLEQYISRGR